MPLAFIYLVGTGGGGGGEGSKKRKFSCLPQCQPEPLCLAGSGSGGGGSEDTVICCLSQCRPYGCGNVSYGCQLLHTCHVHHLNLIAN
ncbi:hypothetical protein E2562_000461 [Oryza meyeriana var. granulata]|uniref:Uncharacterized protein n=1 Tax=Oryza meyeriana var. granulata TaxID=110450 RepID=A0A6G1CC22_9ORYZ|nr:hypothetical protein E2562_000461 [Oryza meyeriana var. granulata]